MAERQLRQILDQLTASAPPHRTPPHNPSHTHSHSHTNLHGRRTSSSDPDKDEEERKGKDKDKDKSVKGRVLTAHSLLSSILHPRMSSATTASATSGSDRPAAQIASTQGLSTAKLTSLLDMLSFTGKRKGPPTLDLNNGTGAARNKGALKRSAHDRQDDEEDMEERIHDLGRRGSGGSDITCTTISPTDSSPSDSPPSDLSSPPAHVLDAHCVDMDRHWTPRSYDPSQSVVFPGFAAGMRGERRPSVASGSSRPAVGAGTWPRAKKVRFSEEVIYVG